VHAHDRAALQAFVRANTIVGAPPLVPEIRLHLATDVTPLWQATEPELGAMGVEPPFWAFAWAGGQALARYLLDTPSVVRGRRVLDVATGSGLVAIAAARAGAASVDAIDLDPLAVVALELNLALNGVDARARNADAFGGGADDEALAAVDVIVAGDVCYDREMAPVATAWLRRRATAGVLVLLGDPGRAYLPEGLVEEARYVVPTPDGVESRDAMPGVVYRMVGA
jgi:predicted nicotinamide N-methyase